MTERDEGALAGMLEQAEADIPALRDMENYAIEQYWRADRAIRELVAAERSRNRLMAFVLIQFVVIAILVAVLAGRA